MCNSVDRVVLGEKELLVQSRAFVERLVFCRGRRGAWRGVGGVVGQDGGVALVFHRLVSYGCYTKCLPPGVSAPSDRLRDAFSPCNSSGRTE